MTHLHHKVSALIDGELHGAARRRALQHTQQCAACRREFDETLALKRRLLGLSAAEPSADLFATLAAVTPDEEPAPETSGRPIATAWRILAGAGTISVAVLTLAYVVGAPDEHPAPQVSPPVKEFSAEFASVSGGTPLADPAVGVFAESAAVASSAAGHAGAKADQHAQGVGFEASAGLPAASGLSHSLGLSAWGLLGAVIIGEGDDVAAVRELRRAVLAPGRVSYRGVRQIDTFDPSGDEEVTLHIEHSPRQGTSFDIISGASDAAATFVASRELLGESRLAGEPLELLVDSYDISLLGSQSVLGRKATVVSASLDGKIDARFWIDDATGLLLRRELYDGGKVVRSTTFTSLHIPKDGFIPHLPPELAVPSTTSLSMQIASPLNDDGWTSPRELCDDFTLTGLNRVDSGDVLHASYSDGLSTVSVFEQRGTLDPSGLAGYDASTRNGTTVYIRYGLPTVAVWQADNIVYTVVTDAPRTGLGDVIDSLPHQGPDEAGVGMRVGTGLQRLGALVNPGD